MHVCVQHDMKMILISFRFKLCNNVGTFCGRLWNPMNSLERDRGTFMSFQVNVQNGIPGPNNSSPVLRQYEPPAYMYCSLKFSGLQCSILL